MAKNKDMEDLILLFLVIVLLVATVGMTQGREHMSKKKEPPPMSREKSLEVVTAVLEKHGPKGTLGLFDAQIQKMEDLAAKEDEKDE
jgi:hypothetical protein